LRATAEEIDAMRLAIEADISRNTTAGNPSRIFHDALARAAHNPALVQVYESGRHLFFRLPFYWKLFDDAEVKSARAARHELARRWHEQILKAIVERDAAEAEGAMFQHLDIMEKDLLSRLQLADGETTSGTAYRHPMLAELQPGKDSVIKGIRSLR
jgi:DNA-binding FadR family transcriptional regulator